MAACPALSMRRLLPILAAACWAGEAEAVRIQLGPATTLETHWHGSVLGRVLADASLEPLRKRGLAWLERYGGGRLHGTHVLQAGFAGLDGKGQPRWAVQSDLGTRAPLVARRIAASFRFPRPIAVPAADEAWLLDGMVLARFGGIVAYGRPVEQLPLAPFHADGDIAVEIGVPALLRALRDALEDRRPVLAGLFDLVAARWSSLSVRADLTAEGSSWRGALLGDSAGLKTADRSLLARLPASAMAVMLIGIDGRRLWSSSGRALASALAGAMQGLPDLRTVIEGCNGTIAILLTPGVPYPGISVVLPHGPGLEDLATTLCRRMGVEPPAEGGNTFIVVPDLAIPLMLARSGGLWLLSSDAQLAASWGTAAASGFERTAMASTLQQRAPAAACVLLTCDGGAVLRSLMGVVNQAMALNREFDQTERHAVLSGAARLSASLMPAYQWAVAARDRLDLAGGGGDLTWIAAPVLAAAWTIPGWIDNGAGASEVAAVTTLKSILFPAEMQFQAAGHIDQDGDAIGEYGLLSELAGRRPAGAGKVDPLQGPLATAETSQGYRFAVYLPDGLGGAVGEPDGLQPRPSIVGVGMAPDADAQEQHFVIYAWPAEGEAGQRMFAIDQSGQVREHLWDGQAPAWNSLYDGGEWADEPAWPAVKRGARRR